MLAPGSTAPGGGPAAPAGSLAAARSMATVLADFGGTRLPRSETRSAGRVKLLHAITSTGLGGAQSMLVRLLTHGEQTFDGYEQSVLSLMSPGDLARQLDEAGVAVHTLAMGAGLPRPSVVPRLVDTARRAAPDLIVGWMHHGGLAAWYAAKLHRPRRPVIWNLRHSLGGMAHEKRLTRLVLQHMRRLSPHVDAIVYNSYAARSQYKAIGFADAHAVVIPNGFDCDLLRPRADARARLSQIFGIDPGRLVIGMVARYHPMKDPAALIEAVRRLRDCGHDAHLLVVGTGMDGLARHIDPALAAALPPTRITFSDQRLDVADWLPGLDVLALPSAWGEGFPNILGEAMACGVPCVATDVGDADHVLGSFGRLVPPRDPEALCAALAEICKLSPEARRRLGHAGRERVRSNFSIAAVAARYASLYDEVWSRSQGSRSPERRGRERPT